MIGKTISHYRILEKLGKGGMGVVYKAHDLRLRRDVAMKFLPEELAQSSDLRERFYIEARAASALNHPNVATIYDIDEAAGEHFITMEYVQGTTLRERIDLAQPADEILRLALQIARGLYAAHQKGIIHRDIKPDNIMVTVDGQAKIMDFGLAKLADEARLTLAGTTVGTVAYMSPEQVRGEVADQRSDIWSFGVMLYEVFTQTRPFHGDHVTARMFEILNKEAPRLAELRKDLPNGLDAIVAKTLAKNPADRYQHFGELISDLELVRSGSAPTATILHSALRSSKIRWSIVAAIVALGAVGLSLFLLLLRPASANGKTIAVLPFTNMSGNPEDEYFSDGVTEDILTQLGKIADLRVISRTTMMQYKGTKKALRDIGKELSAGVLLEGSVRRAANTVRITAQLIDVSSDEHLWAESYDKEFKEIFAIQSDVAQKIAAALQAKLSPAEKERIEKKPTANTDAYDYYIKGREYYYRYTKQDNETAIDLFRKALDLDPGYALACAGLGDAYAQRYSRFGLTISWLDSSVEASKKAIALDENSAEAYKALGNALSFKGLYDKALEAYRAAVELNPNHAPAVGNIGFTYYDQGRFDEALPWLRKAAVLTPTVVTHHAAIGDANLLLGNFIEAERWLRKALELQPDYPQTSYSLAYLYLIQNNDRQANEQMEKLVTLSPDNPRILDWAGGIAENTGNLPQAKEYYERSMKANPALDSDPEALTYIGLGHIFLKEGKQREAQKMLDRVQQLQKKLIDDGNASQFPRYNLAAICAIEGNTKESNAWLQKAIDAGWRYYYISQRDAWFENLRNDEQYKQMMAHVKAKVDEMRKRVADALEK